MIDQLYEILQSLDICIYELTDNRLVIGHEINRKSDCIEFACLMQVVSSEDNSDQCEYDIVPLFHSSNEASSHWIKIVHIKNCYAATDAAKMLYAKALISEKLYNLFDDDDEINSYDLANTFHELDLLDSSVMDQDLWLLLLEQWDFV